MVSSKALSKLFLSGAVLIACCYLALALPASGDYDENEKMQADDYDYGNEETNNSNPQSKVSNIAKSDIPSNLQNRSVTVLGKLGDDITLQCDKSVINKNTVILWYQGDQLLTHSNSLVVPNFKFDPETFDLTILKSSPKSVGDYYCQAVLGSGQKVYQHSKVILGEHSMEVIVPESSTSAQASLQRFTWLWLLTLALAVGRRSALV